MHTSVISAYIWGLGVLIFSLALAIVVSNSIKYQSGANPQDGKKRRMWYWIFFAVCVVLTFAMPYVFVYTGIKVPAKQSQYLIHMSVATGVTPLLYILIGLLISKTFSKHGKLSNWF